jgi:translation initiation factor 2 alpha subunit (eIF-2alpha)
MTELEEARSVARHLWKKYGEPFHWFRAASGGEVLEDARLPEKHPWLSPVPAWVQNPTKEATSAD